MVVVVIVMVVVVVVATVVAADYPSCPWIHAILIGCICCCSIVEVLDT